VKLYSTDNRCRDNAILYLCACVCVCVCVSSMRKATQTFPIYTPLVLFSRPSRGLSVPRVFARAAILRRRINRCADGQIQRQPVSAIDVASCSLRSARRRPRPTPASFRGSTMHGAVIIIPTDLCIRAWRRSAPSFVREDTGTNDRTRRSGVYRSTSASHIYTAWPIPSDCRRIDRTDGRTETGVSGRQQQPCRTVNIDRDSR